MVCANCLASPPPWERVWAPLRYGGLGRDLLLALKHGDRLDLAPVFAGWMAQSLPQFPLFGDNALLVPVPLHVSRLRSRLYNQSAELARGIALRTRLPVSVDIVRRTRPVLQKGAQSRAARLRQMRGSFQINDKERVMGISIILVDDVMTTGATLRECAIALKRAGARKIFGLVALRA